MPKIAAQLHKEHLSMDYDDPNNEQLMRCLARHVINKAKQAKDEWDHSWDVLNGNGKKQLIEQVFMKKFRKRQKPEIIEDLYAFIRCELRNGA